MRTTVTVFKYDNVSAYQGGGTWQVSVTSGPDLPQPFVTTTGSLYEQPHYAAAAALREAAKCVEAYLTKLRREEAASG